MWLCSGGKMSLDEVLIDVYFGIICIFGKVVLIRVIDWGKNYYFFYLFFIVVRIY